MVFREDLMGYSYLTGAIKRTANSDLSINWHRLMDSRVKCFNPEIGCLN